MACLSPRRGAGGQRRRERKMTTKIAALVAVAAGAVTVTSAASGAVETKQRAVIGARSASHGVVTRDSRGADSEPLSRTIADVGSSVAARSTDSAGRTIYYTDGRWYYA